MMVSWTKEIFLASTPQTLVLYVNSVWVILAFVLILIALIVWWALRWRGEKLDHPVEQPRPVLPAASAEAPSTPMTQYIPSRQNGTLSAPSSPLEADDLTLIDGINQGIADLLQAEGISTYAQLAAVDVAILKSILEEAHLGYWVDPSTWPVQARLAADGRLEELKAYQAKRKG